MSPSPLRVTKTQRWTLAFLFAPSLFALFQKGALHNRAIWDQNKSLSRYRWLYLHPSSFYKTLLVAEWLVGGNPIRYLVRLFKIAQSRSSVATLLRRLIVITVRVRTSEILCWIRIQIRLFPQSMIQIQLKKIYNNLNKILNLLRSLFFPSYIFKNYL